MTVNIMYSNCEFNFRMIRVRATFWARKKVERKISGRKRNKIFSMGEIDGSFYYMHPFPSWINDDWWMPKPLWTMFIFRVNRGKKSRLTFNVRSSFAIDESKLACTAISFHHRDSQRIKRETFSFLLLRFWFLCLASSLMN